MQLPSFFALAEKNKSLGKKRMNDVKTQGSSPFSFSENSFRLLVLEVNSSFLLAESFSVDAWDQAGKQK